MKTFKAILFWSLTIVALIQFIPIDHTNKAIKKSETFVDIYHTPVKIQNLLKNACYDCHSNETKYPLYAFIAPVSWSLKNHVSSGREHLNFSEFGRFNKDLKKNMLENSIKDLEARTMPMVAYVAYHPKANLNTAERKLLSNYFQQILDAKKF